MHTCMHACTMMQLQHDFEHMQRHFGSEGACQLPAISKLLLPAWSVLDAFKHCHHCLPGEEVPCLCS
jgi:hypothetical protein